MNTVFDAFNIEQFLNMKALIATNNATILDLAYISSALSNVTTN